MPPPEHHRLVEQDGGQSDMRGVGVKLEAGNHRRNAGPQVSPRFRATRNIVRQIAVVNVEDFNTSGVTPVLSEVFYSLMIRLTGCLREARDTR